MSNGNETNGTSENADFTSMTASLSCQESFNELANDEIMLVMAYSEDYSIGKLCEEVNRTYANKYGYQFHSVVEPCATMLQTIAPKLHLTWYKIYIFMTLMKENCKAKRPIKYFCWIDGDAFVLHHDISIQSLISKAQGKDFIIAEDMHPGCLINAGVFFMKVSEWCSSLLEEVWHSSKYDDVFFYEQSAIMKALRQRRESLHKLKPFHSYSKNGPQGVKLFPHVAVFPHTELSSNIGVERAELEQLLATEGYELTVRKHTFQDSLYDSSLMFIYHAAGLRGKLDYIRAAIIKYSVPCTIDEELRGLTFKLNRNSLGHYLYDEEKASLSGTITS